MASAKDEVLKIRKRAKNDKVSMFLTPTLAEIDITHLGYWYLRRLFSFNLPYIDLFRNFQPRMTLNKVDKNFLLDLPKEISFFQLF